MNTILMILALLSGGQSEKNLDPASMLVKQIVKGVYDETRVQTLEINQKKYPHNTVD
jgi:hypothetical protein